MEMPNDNGGYHGQLSQFMDPFVKREEEVLHTNKCTSIAERRATKCGFNASHLSTLPPPIGEPYLTIPSGISPSTLLDSPVMLPNIQAQSSPTTGTFQMKLANNAQGFPNSSGLQNKPFEEIKYGKDLQEMAHEDSFVEATLENSQDMNQSLLHTKSDIDNKCHERNTHQKGASSFRPKLEVAKCLEDGYYWRKYGQKQVKGSKRPRSYFKCTNTSCQVKKKVECSHDGQITQIIYKGKHTHPQPQPTFNRMSDQRDEGEATTNENNNDINMPGKSPLSHFSNQFLTTTETQEILSNFDIQDNEASPDNISLNDEDYERELKRRKKDSFPTESSSISRSTREPRVIVQIESDIDILNDGYRWRKYGQKVVKGNPNPRSYYKCTTQGCPVRKHVERAPDDKKSVITTYEGKHNHEVPSSKNGNLMINSEVATNNSISTMSHKHEHGPKSGKQPTQDLHSIYSEQNLMLNYNEAMWPNFGPSLPQYPIIRLPSFPYNSHLLNGSNYHTKNFPSSNIISPMLPNYIPPMSMSTMAMPMMQPMNHINQAAVSGDMYGNSLQVNNYVAMQSSIQGQETYKESEAETFRPKEEP